MYKPTINITGKYNKSRANYTIYCNYNLMLDQ